MRVSFYVLLAAASVSFAYGDSRFTGSVADSSGAGISGATILIHWDPAGSEVGLASNVGIKQDLVVKTDRDGKFAADLPPGFYDVFVSSMAFTPACRKLRLKGAAPLDVKFRMAVDPGVVKELGDAIVRR
jgi:hypothetical protein